MPLALLCVLNIEKERLQLTVLSCCQVTFLGDFGVSGLIQAFLFYLCVFQQLLGCLGFLIATGFLRLASLCGVLPLVLVRGSSDHSLVFSTFVLGGGG